MPLPAARRPAGAPSSRPTARRGGLRARARSSSATPPAPTGRSGPRPSGPRASARRAVRAAHARAADPRRGVGRGHAWPSCAAGRACATATPNYIARASFIPNDPGRAAPRRAAGRACSGTSWPVTGVNAPAAWDNVAARRAARRPRRRRRGARHRRRLRGPRPLPPLARPARATRFGAATTSSTTTATRTTTTATARTSRPRSPRAPTTASASPASPTARGSCRCACSTAAARATARRSPRGIRFAARHGAHDHQPLVRVRRRRSPRGEIPDILDALRYARRKGALVVGASGNERRAVRRLPGARRRRAVGRRDDRARLPRRLLQRAARPRPRRARRRRRTPTLAGDPNCRPARRPGPRHRPDDLRRQRPRASACRAATSARRWPRRTCRPPPRSSSPPACSGPTPTPAAIEARLKATARDLGAARARTTRYGAGLIDAAAPPRTPPPAAQRRPDDQHRAGRVVGDLVRHGAEQEALGAGHALVADDDQVGAALLGDVEDRVGRIALARVGARLDAGRARRRSAASRSVASTSSRGLTIHCRSAGTWRASSRSRWLGDRLVGGDELQRRARSARRARPRRSTALPAVSEPSVPTTIERNTARSYELDDRDHRARSSTQIDDHDLHPDPERGHRAPG